MRIVCIGDSITDDWRDRGNPEKLTAYVQYLPELLGEEHTYKQLGIGGSRSEHVLERYERDVKANLPDMLVMLVGINDVWHRHNEGIMTTVEQYKHNLTQIATKAKIDFPSVKLIMLEPFLLPAEDKKAWRTELMEIIDACRDVADEYADEYIPLNTIFASLCEKESWTNYVNPDGVHPEEGGKRLIANFVAKAIKNQTI